ncbi:hypothetical protein C0584_02200 [Candidatus Parcubacteria bacterium]|nr:MAG: hypothetical protein C0584_02200 [Candidatus Parcubacteria bacterium]
MFTDFKFLLNRAVRRSGASSFVEESSALSFCNSVLKEMFSVGYEKVKILDFSEGSINIACLCEDFAKDLSQKEQILIDKINEKLGNPLVKSINIVT